MDLGERLKKADATGKYQRELRAIRARSAGLRLIPFAAVLVAALSIPRGCAAPAADPAPGPSLLARAIVAVPLHPETNREAREAMGRDDRSLGAVIFVGRSGLPEANEWLRETVRRTPSPDIAREAATWYAARVPTWRTSPDAGLIAGALGEE